ncbi:MAG: glycoside hydrolase family 3 C-terminal domain-containing protein, partial [Clostridia bacterium]|nr:glycoside hydrolase family 3 C-terminal domain-containing protein [Clostridia bacterium]
MKKNLLKIISVVLAFLAAFCNTAFATSGDVDPAIIAETKETAVQIESEGIVLLKNEDNFLPLENKKVNIFGAGSVCPFFGGAGSGAITTDDPVTLYEAFEAEGIEYNAELRSLYEKHCLSNELPKTDNTVINNLLQVLLAKNTLEEMNPKYLTDELLDNAVKYSDIAIIVISRTSAEGTDHTVETLSLSDDEKAMVEKVTSAFENVVVLFNIGNVMEMGWIDEYESIKAAAVIWIPGEFGMMAVPQMLDGKVNPSGRLTDTIS